MNTYGFIVGIEKYDEPTWDIEGPCNNAIAMAAWLQSIGVPGQNIHLFLSSSRDLKNETAAAAAKGVDLRHNADAASIDKFWRLHLTKGVPAGSRLFAFWSGHGCTSATRQRIFFCSDYQSKLPGCVFNSTNFVNHLLTPDYGCFTDQILMADVCGVYSEVPVTEVTDKLTLIEREQLVIYATPEGRYAKGNNDRGVFTSVVLDVLTPGAKWPAQLDLVRSLEQALACVDCAPFIISGFHNQGAIRESVVGGNVHFQAVTAMLEDLDVVESLFRPHYLRTVTALGNPELAKAADLRAAIRELSRLGGVHMSKALPAGLLQFLARLACENDLRQPINRWLDEHAKAQKNTLSEIRRKLERELQTKILIIVTEVNAREEIAAYKPFLCNSDCLILPDKRFERKIVAGWAPFVRGLQDTLVAFVSDGRLCNLEVHFAVDPALFDRSFHLIPVGPHKQAIGEDAVVVVRHKQRMLSPDRRLVSDWHACADKLRATKPRDLKWLPLSIDDELPAEKGLFFACFTLPEPAKGKRASRAEKETLRRLLQLGIPYIYLPHAPPDGDDWDKVEKRLTTVLSHIATLEEFPSAFLVERIRRAKFAQRGTIIWDDPRAVPIGLLEGVRFG